jgi:ADP-heptose:LPS heptosyltransferase
VRPRTSEHVLVARLDNDGDVLLTGPAVRAAAAGAGRVTMLCGPRGHAAAELLPGVDEVLVHRAPWIDPEPGPVDRAAQLGLVEDLGSRRLDRAIVFTSHHQSALPLALLLRLAGVPFIGATSADYPGSLLDVRHRDDDLVHEFERSLSLAGACGYALPRADDGRLAVRHDPIVTPPVVERPYVVVHPGASVTARAWAPERNAELVDALVERGRRVVVTGSSDEARLTARVAGPLRAAVTDLGGATTLADLVEVLANAEAVVVGNTGPAHLAAAVGTPVVSLFAPTVPATRWRPWKVAHELLHVEVACAGCRARECPVPGHPCLDELSVGSVVAALERLVGRAQRTAAPAERAGPAETPAGLAAGVAP